MSLKDFELLNKLGEGAFSNVYKVKRISDGQIYALKKVRFGPLKPKEKENALNEVRILASVQHQNIVAYKEAFIDHTTDTLCIIMEFADGGDLLMKITDHRKRGTYFPEAELWSIFIQTVHGLKVLHDLKILHRDLKCANIFLNKDGLVKLGDLNVSKVAKKGLVYTQTGTPYYASPEVWSDKPYDSRSDIWSLGCVLYEAAALNPPFRAQDMQGLYKKVTKGEYPDIPRQYSSDLSNMVRSLLQVNPALRPACDRILDMPAAIRNSIRNTPSVSQFDSPDLLGTIKLTPNLGALRNVLPAPNYEKRGRHLSAHPRSPLDIKKDIKDIPRLSNSRDVRIRQEILSPKMSQRPPVPSSASRAIRPPSRPLSKEGQRPPSRPLSKEIPERPRIGSRGQVEPPSSRPLVKNRSEDLRPRAIQEPSRPRPIQEPSRPRPIQEPSRPRPIQEPSRPRPIQETPSTREIDAIKRQQQIFKNQADSARSPALRYGGQQIMKEYSKNPLLPSPIYKRRQDVMIGKLNALKAQFDRLPSEASSRRPAPPPPLTDKPSWWG